jgi:hypothetical protein
MEGAMPIGRRYREANYHILDYGREPDFDFGPPDATSYWFLAAVLFAFIAAGIIVYRTGAIAPTQAATIGAGHPAAQTDDPIAPTALLQAR